VIGCGDVIEPGCIYCRAHRRNRQSRPDLSGPAPDHELDIRSYRLAERLAGQEVERGVYVCAFDDCGQPCLAGRLYCSDRCRARARREPALFTIDGVTATLPQHAKMRGVDIGTVYCRMKLGLAPEEAVTRALDDLQHQRRTGGRA